MAAEPLPRTFFNQSVRPPYGRAIKKLSPCRAAITGVWYVRPDRRPTWRTTDVPEPSLPARAVIKNSRHRRQDVRPRVWGPSGLPGSARTSESEDSGRLAAMPRPAVPDHNSSGHPRTGSVDHGTVHAALAGRAAA